MPTYSWHLITCLSLHWLMSVRLPWLKALWSVARQRLWFNLHIFQLSSWFSVTLSNVKLESHKCSEECFGLQQSCTAACPSGFSPSPPTQGELTGSCISSTVRKFSQTSLWGSIYFTVSSFPFFCYNTVVLVEIDTKSFDQMFTYNVWNEASFSLTVWQEIINMFPVLDITYLWWIPEL